ncbi:A/G-specific adenine glycosylase [Dactylosporangium fulvum]|uniref:Adenine DNA glycosylase n=1 Tax=Dactylosporangium fulvum TaxID=53359 RepID=A0ABY5W0S5_9ACTN|nr:A/G-specific adenine glycosylase [Dactylosporangium fulvum]UWP82985.1 A/G-specific adenine glycosylase [Dactylosporangium fulvum]
MRIATEAIAQTVTDWYDKHARDLPWRQPDASPWGVLVSEVMLQQTQVSRVEPAWHRWMERWPTPAHLAADPPGEAIRAWDRLGYPRRALRLHACATAIVERHDGEVPDDVDALLALPGIGMYTARAVAAFAFRQRHPVVDTNVRRVVARVVEGAADGGAATTPADLRAVEVLLPDDHEAAARASVAFMELGAMICTARAPRCADCPLTTVCAWRLAGSPPADGPSRRTQRYHGTDRYVRGLMMAVLRASDEPVPLDRLDEVWPDAQQRQRALDGLLADGLARRRGAMFTLPG